MKFVYRSVKAFATDNPFYFVLFVSLIVVAIHVCSGTEPSTWMHKPVGTMDRGELLFIIALCVLIFR